LNRQIARLFALIVVLFAVLVGFTSRWAVFEAESLEANTANRRPLLEQETVPRGLILADDGARLAESRRLGTAENPRYVRDYPAGPLFSHAVGYSFVDCGRAGLESFYNDELAGRSNEFGSIVDTLLGDEREGDDLYSNLDPEAQRVAVEGLAGRPGAVVALEPATGRVRVMASVPEYDPNAIPDRCSELNNQAGSPLLDRATQSLYPPGSTMKVVAAAAALDSGEFTPDSVLTGDSGIEIGGVPLANFGGSDFGSIPLTTALTNSVNTVWAQVGEQVGAGTLFDYMERFGFGEDPPLDYPPDELVPSGVFEEGEPIDAGDPVDIGRVAIGQERLLVTPLQMAMVAAAVGNGGELMAPRVGNRIEAADGRVKDELDAVEVRQVMEPEAAAQLAEMMSNVVREGSGTAAALEGIEVAGKTGTAEVEGGATNQAWFIGFAPVQDPDMAIAVTIERTSGQGGTEAAPIAKSVLEQLLGP
jgi:peptidoglycan glycosyltransferase